MAMQNPKRATEVNQATTPSSDAITCSYGIVGVSASDEPAHGSGAISTAARPGAGRRNRARNPVGSTDAVESGHSIVTTSSVAVTERAASDGSIPAVYSWRCWVTGCSVASSWPWSRSHSQG